MTLFDLVNELARRTPKDLLGFLPELVLCGTIVLTLLARMLPVTQRLHASLIAVVGSLTALYFAWRGLSAAGMRTELFGGLLVLDTFSVYIRIVLLLFVVLFTVFTRVSGIPDRDAATDFYPLVLGATLGMCLMAGANHMLIVFLAVEMASVPSYALAGALKGRRKSSEAALKYAVYGAGAAGVMLYGISLLSGVLGSVHLPTMAQNLAQLFAAGATEAAAGKYLVLALGGLMVMVGLAFKLSAVPFHFWCPDVFEGASAEVDAFLSVASKAAALALVVRVALGLGTIVPVTAVAMNVEKPVIQQPFEEVSAVDMRGQSPDGKSILLTSAAKEVDAQKALAPVRKFMSYMLAFFAVITCTFGNLAAYGQTNIKRLLAYSTIAHAGYMLMPIAAALAMAGTNPAGAGEAIAALVFYITTYLFMNLGAFAVVAFVRNTIDSEEIADYAGLIQRMPVISVCFILMLVSLIGIPPLAGFSGKYLIFASLWNSKLLAVLVIAGLNTAISLYFYLRVIKTMTFSPPPEHATPATFPFGAGVLVVLFTTPVVLLGVFFNDVLVWAQRVSGQLFS
jgi:NADH-quinone oxidoreductase subunit N